MSTASNADLPLVPTAAAPGSPNPTIIGIYGVSGCGKSYLSEQLKKQLGETTFSFYEGSEQLANMFKDNLEEFKRLAVPQQNHARSLAIDSIRRECLKTGKAGIVTGHYAFWTPNADPQVVMTEEDKRTYTHILYLRPSAETVVKQVARDSARRRQQLDAATVHGLQDFEETQLRSICRDNGILFMTIQPETSDRTTGKVLRDAARHDETVNGALLVGALDRLLQLRPMRDVKTMLVLDADNTLAPYDASTLYWDLSAGKTNPLKNLFKSPLGYSYTAFRQITWRYE